MNRDFWKSVTSVFSGTFAAQAIPIAGALLLARLCGPEAFGEYSVWLSAVLLLAVVSTLRLEMALAVLPDGTEREAAMSMVVPTILVVGAVAGLIAATGILASGWNTTLASPAMLASFIMAAMLSAACDTWQALAAADGSYGHLVRLRIAQACLIVGGQLVFSALNTSAHGLIIGHFVGLALSVVLAIRWRPITWPSHHRLPRNMWVFWKSQSRFPTYALPADALNSLSAQLPALIVSARFGAASAGLVALAFRVLGAPISILGRAVLDVFRRHAASAYRERGECRSEYLATAKVLTAGSIALISGTYLFGEPTISLTFGDKWNGAAGVMIIMVPLFALRFIASPLSYLFYIAGSQHIDLLWQIGLFAVTSAALLIPQRFDAALMAYAVAYSMMYLVYILISYSISKGQTR